MPSSAGHHCVQFLVPLPGAWAAPLCHESSMAATCDEKCRFG
ncbi:hypothetical protein HMPREF9570_00340 [Cutibacterium acnes HL043PA1]|nr:hypothetical protein HMPREF9570_00340 [Cutibacterium acnes HL043PA1]